MDIRFIGLVKDTKNNTAGYRLVDLDDRSVKDVPSIDVINVLSRGNIKIAGLELKGHAIVGSNGSIDRYPVIQNKNIVGTSPLVIATQLLIDGDIVGYKVLDWKGTMSNASLQDVIKYAKSNGISNGAIKRVGNREFVSSISGEYNKVEGRSQRKITEDIEKTIWTMEDFEKHMKSKQYDYVIRKSDIHNNVQIQFNCGDAKVLKYPLGVDTINNMFVPNGALVELLILSPSITSVSSNLLAVAKHIKRIVLQQGIKAIHIGGITGNGEDEGATLKEISFPASLERITNGASGLSGITQLDLSGTQLSVLNYSFNNLNKLTDLRLANSLKEIHRSFRQVKSLKQVRFPDELISIASGCFMESGLKIADLSNCTRLITLGSEVLKDNIHLEEVILPDNVEEIGFSALTNCKELKYINMPKNLKRINSSALAGFALGTFVVTDKMINIGSHVFTEDTLIKFDTSNTEVKMSIMASPGFKSVELPETITIIRDFAFSENTKLCAINIPKGLEEIANYAFRLCTNLAQIRLQDSNRLKRIGESAFEKCIFTHIILPDGVEELGQSCFTGCESIEYMVLPRSLEKIGKHAFFSVGSKIAMGTTYYVYDKSYGLKYCKRNNFKYIIINKLEDVYNARNSAREIEKSKEAKMKMLLSTNEIHRELFEDGYLNYADILFRLYNHVTGDLMRSAYKSKLNTKNLIKFPVKSIRLIDKYLMYEAESLNNMGDIDRIECIEEYKEDNLSLRFITLCNYVTSTIPFNHTPLTTNSLEFLDKEADINYGTVYYDNCSSIIILGVKDKVNGVTEERNIVIVVTIGDNIRFVGVLEERFDTAHHGIINQSHSFKVKPKASVADLLEIGDTLNIVRYNGSKYNTVGGAPLPRYIYSAVIRNMEDHFTVLGHESLDIIKNKDKGINIKADFLCKDTGKVVSVQGKLDSEYTTVMKSIRDLSDALITDVQDFTNMGKETERRMLAGVEFDTAKRFYAYKSQGEDYLNNLGKLAGAFDNEPSYEWEVSQLLNKINTTNIDEMSVAMVTMLFDTGLFAKTKKSLSDVKKLGKDAKAYRLEDGRYAVLEFRLKRELKSKKVIDGVANYIMAIIDTQESENSTQDFYMANKNIADTILKLLRIKEIEHTEPSIDNVARDTADVLRECVTIQRQIFTMYKDGFNYQCFIAISKSDGGVYLMASDVDDSKTTFKILRFKTLEIGLKYCPWMYTNYHIKERKSDTKDVQMRDEVMQVVNNLNSLSRYGSTGYVDEDNIVDLVRKAVMRGIPNGAYIKSKSKELFNDVAKQEIKASI